MQLGVGGRSSEFGVRTSEVSGRQSAACNLQSAISQKPKLLGSFAIQKSSNRQRPMGEFAKTLVKTPWFFPNYAQYFRSKAQKEKKYLNKKVAIDFL